MPDTFPPVHPSSVRHTTKVDGETRLMGLLGEDIAYTRSPALHNRAAALLGINVLYMPLPLPAKRVAPFLDAAWDLGAVGFNVTTPHKELVGKYVAKRLEKKGATVPRSVNTLYRGKKGWLAASTDAEGFALGLERAGRALESFERIVVLGSGGAAVALMEHWATLPFAKTLKLVVHRRDKSRDGALRRAVAAHKKLKASLAIAPLKPAAVAKTLAGAGPETLLVQATKAPQSGDDMSAFDVALDDFHGVVADLVYGKPSALYFGALSRNLTAQDGEAMLVEQARLSQRLWWGKAASYEDLAAVLRGK
jgi:shikimate dehydrogenase